jgi:hypothetical protein
VTDHGTRRRYSRFSRERIVSETAQESPVENALIRRAKDTYLFLRMAAIELRRIADADPDVAVELDHMVKQLEAAAADLRGVDTDAPDDDAD